MLNCSTLNLGHNTGHNVRPRRQSGQIYISLHLIQHFWVSMDWLECHLARGEAFLLFLSNENTLIRNILLNSYLKNIPIIVYNYITFNPFSQDRISFTSRIYHKLSELTRPTPPSWGWSPCWSRPCGPQRTSPRCPWCWWWRSVGGCCWGRRYSFRRHQTPLTWSETKKHNIGDGVGDVDGGGWYLTMRVEPTPSLWVLTVLPCSGL